MSEDRRPTRRDRLLELLAEAPADPVADERQEAFRRAPFRHYGICARCGRKSVVAGQRHDAMKCAPCFGRPGRRAKGQLPLLDDVEDAA